jgi:regulator of protease activity HflC (stomatin/prohibitin superfamily)
MGPESIAIAALAAFLVVLFGLFVAARRQVPPWAQMVVYRWGRTGPDLVFGPGFRLIFPIMDRTDLVDMREQTVKLARQSVVTSDGAPRGVECQIRYQVVDALASQINVHNVRDAIQGVTSTMLRDIVVRTHSADVQARRTRIAEEVHVKLGEAVARWGVRVLKVEIGEIGSPNRSSVGDAVVAR